MPLKRKTYKYTKGNKKQEDRLVRALVKLTKELKAREAKNKR